MPSKKQERGQRSPHKTTPKVSLKSATVETSERLPTIAERVADLTALERSMVLAIGTSEYHDSDNPGGTTWTEVITDGSHSFATVLGSLVKRGLAQSEGQGKDETCHLTEDGVYVFEQISSDKAVTEFVQAKTAPATNGIAKQSSKTVAWKWRHDSGSFGIIRIVNGAEGYYFAEHGRGGSWRLTKIEPNRRTTYAIVLHDSDDPAKSQCGCPAGEKNQRCKHIDGLLSLRQMDKL